MGLNSKRGAKAPEKPIVEEKSKTSSTYKTKVHRNPNRIPPVIQEATEDDNSSNHKEQNTEIPIAGTDQSMKTDGSSKGITTSDSMRRNSYITSETGHSSRRNGNNILAQNSNITRTNSVPGSTRSTERTSSVQSLTVIREQYCCCSKWTRCERILGLTVGLMAIIIVILIVVIGILSSNSKRSNFSGLSLAFR